MADKLQVILAVDNSCVSSQETVTVTATLTDQSDTPRTWKLDDAQLFAFPGNTALPGNFLPGPPNAKLVVPAGGSLTVSALISFKAGNNDIEYAIGATFFSGGTVWSNSNTPTVWVAPSSPPPVDVPSAGQLDFRSNLESGLVVTLTGH